MVDTDQIKLAYDHFEKEDYVASKEILAQQIKQAKNEWLQKTLNLTDYAQDTSSSETE